MGSFALTIFTGAFLLFQVQPLIGKYILPWFGGSPGVWTTCMLFFQVVLVGGYAYAYLIARWFRPRTQAILHLGLILAALALLPITPSESWKPNGPGYPMLRILGLLTVCLGLPYFILSSTGPLMQQWFSQTNPGRSPYRLYALSNAASFLALVSYPFFFETHLSRTAQARTWGWGLSVFVVCCAFCAIKLLKSRVQAAAINVAEPKGPGQGVLQPTPQDTPLPFATRLLWLALPACASMLLLACTNKLCQDVAVIPFLWILPLALYLLSFVICFDSPRWYVRGPFAVLLGAALGAFCWALRNGETAPLWLLLLIYCGGLFVCCMVCHGELCRHKPEPARLTSFYLTIAVGGAFGSMIVALAAPLIFNDYYELHAGLFLCALLLLISWFMDSRQSSSAAKTAPLYFSKWRRLIVALGSLGLVALGLALWLQARKDLDGAVEQSRNFYGVLKVLEHGKNIPKSHELQLVHGRTLHGVQFTEPLLSLRRTGYYSERGGAGLAFRAIPPGSRRIGLIGLGVGTLASYAQTGDYVRVYEINPDVVRLAKSKFTYLSDCLGKLDVVLGDARLSLETEPPQNFDVLALDAFSGDAVPVHLLTREAFAVYERHLKTNGIIAIHITNRMLDLEPVIDQLARQFSYSSAIIPHASSKPGTLPSLWMLLSHSAEVINSPDIQKAARPAEANWEKGPLWTDDFSSLFQILRPPAPPAMKPDPADEQYTIAAKLYDQGNHPAALAHYKLALQSDPELPEALSNLAWLLATTPNDSLRNGAEAVQLAEKACALSRNRVPAFVGTLAAAYAEAGRFDDAIATVQKACALAEKNGEQGLLSMNQQLMNLYRSHQPYHETRR
jgi:spermidine synthase